MPDPTEDEERWVDAQELLARWRPEPDELRRAREHRDQRLFVVSVTLIGLALALALVLLAVDPPPDPDGKTPAWRAITGFSVLGAGLLFLVVAAALRVPRRRPPIAWGSPLGELTPRQRRALRGQVRGRAPVVPGRIPLARHAADDLLGRRGVLVIQTGFLMSFLGLWIADRSLFRSLFTLALVAVFAGAAVQAHRDGRRARQFLAEHPLASDG